MPLDLYAKVEPKLGFEEEKRRLYEIFLEKLLHLGVGNVLDIGCGSGEFMQLVSQEDIEIEGIDLSCEMVARAKREGLRARCMDLCEVKGAFDGATAVFDVINYIPPGDLAHFFACVKRVLRKGGFFVCDINTLYGFEEIAPGSVILDEEEECIGVDASFDGEKLVTKIIYFQKISSACFRKEHGKITQYYHDIKFLKNFDLELVDIDLISLFGEDIDKALLTFKRI